MEKITDTITIINKTGRDLTIFSGSQDTAGRTFPADGPGAVYGGFNQRGRTVMLDGLPVTCAAPSAPQPPKAEEITGLPPPREGTFYIVPLPVEQAGVALGRTDLVRMGPGRFAEGRQVGAEGFQSSLVYFAPLSGMALAL